MSITIIACALLIVTLITVFLFKNKAPITFGNIMYNIPYKNNQKLDILLPTKHMFKKSPIIFYIHGGAWLIGDKLGINYCRINGAINNLRGQGYTIICPNYTLGKKGKSPFPDCILDIYEAIDWVKINAKHYNLNTDNIGLIGESAGAQIAMMIAFLEPISSNGKYGKTNINFLIDLYGPCDLTTLYNSPVIKNLNVRLNKFLKITRNDVRVEEYIFGFNPDQDRDKAETLLKQYSPVNFLTKNNFPTLIIHGNEDQMVPVDQSKVLKSKMDSLGNSSEIHIFEGMHHSMRKANQYQKDSIQELITDFVLKSYKENN